jgi:hypothetical protein
MSKRGKLKKRLGTNGAPERPSTPRPLFPVAMAVPREDFKLTESQFEQLEKAGGVKLPESLRIQLATLAEFWIGDLRLRLTPRPKQFRKYLEEMDKVFRQAEKACFWDSGPKYHLVHWAMETTVDNALGFPVALAALEEQLRNVQKTVVALMGCLPEDPGRQRPFDDERRFIFLADIFEQAGGKATAYLSSHVGTTSMADTVMADTPFRKFAQLFYSLLPADDKRGPGGFDDALRHAVFARRAQRSP